MVNYFNLESLMQDMSKYIQQMETIGNREYIKTDRRRIIESYNLNQQEQEFSRYFNMCREQWVPTIHGNARYKQCCSHK